MITVKRLRRNRKVIFDQGKFDRWCVYIVEPNEYRKAPMDTEYFSDLLSISKHYPRDKVYRDFLAIYKPTTEKIDPIILLTINKIVESYREEHQTLIEQWLTVIYAGMIAEENKENAILKKRIKHLGIYQVLRQGMPPVEAAEFSKNKPWKVLDTIMKEFGI